MKKNLLNTLALSCILYLTSNFCSAQTYSQGNTTIEFFHSIWHDSTQCATYDSISFILTIQNSSNLDSFRIVRVADGEVLYSAINWGAASPWVINDYVPFYNNATLFDYQVYTPFPIPIEFSYGPFKIYTNTDTIYNMYFDSICAIQGMCEFDTFNGKLFIDNNNNCTYDAGDSLLFVQVNANFYTFHNPQGLTNSYGINPARPVYYGPLSVQKSYLDSFSVNLPPLYNFIFPSLCTPPVYHFTTLPQSNVDFILQCSTSLDVQSHAGYAGTVRPALPFMFYPSVSNTGCTAASGTFTVTLDPRVTYNAGLSTNPATSVAGNTLSWNFTNLVGYSSQGYWNDFIAGLYLTPSGTVNIGDTLCFDLSASIPPNDVDSSNNTIHVCIPIVNSFDPNEKEVEPKGAGAQGVIPQTTTELTYTIHFQNTGTANALNITVLDTLDSHIQPANLRIVSTSHNMTPEWRGDNIAAFHFYNINLPDTGHNMAASTGSVSFRVKLDTTLAPGTQIKNTAAIYFDNNAPVFTNTTLNTIATLTGIGSLPTAAVNFSLSPNPATSTVTISVDESMVGSTATIADITGRVMKNEKLEMRNTTLETANLAAGIYLVNVTGNGGRSATKKLVISK